MMNNLKINKKLIIIIIIPLIVGFISSMLSLNGFKTFNLLDKAPLTPPSWVFIVVWTILYILMGISSYLIYEKNDLNSDTALKVYALSLFINFLWTPVFFGLKLRLFALIIIILLDLLVAYTIYCYHKIKKEAAYLQIPYLIWVLFATYLNFLTYLLNR